ncbi:MAG: transcriptional repressor LexA [Immundisolibacter sp.]|uniref:transcriptional repressor LexA n=1 Tax=Immundisolibacter sp. TaxID=1934948 RepID=UPI0019B37912|nr:transcriptional repressor LexA [Immundisolibacter sp.]MBC7162858.1 transcriptional repressor LexA [Immundisolibacter sp.]
MKLTVRQQQVLDFITASVTEAGMPPTRVEIARQFGFRSINAAEQHLRALARKGAIDLMAGTSRGIRLKQSTGLPVVGQVAAGSPLLAEENLQGARALSGTLFSPKADYLLRVSGLSMRDAGILDGDLLAVHATPKANNGDLVVARIDGEVTVKRFQRKGGKVTLLAANPDFAPIEIDPRKHEFVIEGLGVGLLRDLS